MIRHLTFALSIAFSLPSFAVVPPDIELATVQELVRGNGAEPGSLDPNKVEAEPGAHIVWDLFEGLVNQDRFGNIIPGVATSWQPHDDNYRWVFKLRATARWSNGEPVTAQDFVYAWRRLVDPAAGSPYAWYLEMAGVKHAAQIIQGVLAPNTLGIAADDAYTLTVTLDKPVPYFVRMMAHSATFPLHRDTVEKHGKYWTRPGIMVSNGAYQLSEWVVNERIVLVRNPRYWNNAQTIIDKVTFLPIASEIAELNRYRTNEIDFTSTVPLEHFKKLRETQPDEVKTQPQIGIYFYAFNTRRPPFDDKRLRKALSLATDRELITRHVMDRGEKPAWTFTPDIVSGYHPPTPAWAGWTQAQRNAEANRLYTAAGYSSTRPLKFTLLYNSGEANKKLALAVSSMWKQVLGAEVTLKHQEWKTYLDTLRFGKFDVARRAWFADYNEASSMLDLHVSTHHSNHAKYHNPEYDRIMRESKQLSDENARNALYDEAEKILDADVPNLTVYQPRINRLVKPWVGGYAVENPEGHFYTRDMYIVKH